MLETQRSTHKITREDGTVYYGSRDQFDSHKRTQSAIEDKRASDAKEAEEAQAKANASPAVSQVVEQPTAAHDVRTDQLIMADQMEHSIADLDVHTV